METDTFHIKKKVLSVALRDKPMVLHACNGSTPLPDFPLFILFKEEKGERGVRKWQTPRGQRHQGTTSLPLAALPLYHSHCSHAMTGLKPGKILLHYY